MSKKKAKKRSHTDTNGATPQRDEHGRFAKGNQAATGNLRPSVQKARELKDALLASVSAADIQIIVRKLIEKAKEGDIRAAKEILDRTLGKSLETVKISGIEPLSHEDCELIRKILKQNAN